MKQHIENNKLITDRLRITGRNDISFPSPSVLTRGAGKTLNSSLLDSPIKSKMTSLETGRSMVETLGVLAIVAVLSIGGIAGYSMAMNHHRANVIQEQAYLRAVVVAGQIMSGHSPSLEAFKNNTDLGYAVFDDMVYGEDGTSSWAISDRQFSLHVKLTDKPVCEKLQNMATDMIRKFMPEVCGEEATVILTYNNNLSTNDSLPTHKCNNSLVWCDVYDRCQSEQEPCTCPDNSSLIGTGEIVPGTTCKCEDTYLLRDGKCVPDIQCNPPCEDETFCYLYRGADYDCTKGPDRGVCVELEKGTKKQWGTKTLLVSDDDYNFWAAENWCQAHGMQLLDLSTLDIALPDEEIGTCDFADGPDYEGKVLCKTTNGTIMSAENGYGDTWAVLKEKIGSGNYWTRNQWVSHPASYPCAVWSLVLGYAGLYHYDTNETAQVICE